MKNSLKFKLVALVGRPGYTLPYSFARESIGGSQMSDQALNYSESDRIPKSQNLWWSAVVLAVIGIGLSLYSVKHHLELRANGHTDAFCNISAQINCDVVASSKYAELFGIPVGVFGAGYFLAMAFLAATTALGHKTRKEHEAAWLILAGAGVVASLVFGGISLGVLNAVCIVCIATYVVTLLQAAVAYVISRDGDQRSFQTKTIGNGLTSAAVAMAIVIVAFNFLRPSAELPKELQDVAGKHDHLAESSMTLSPNKVDIQINRTPYSGAGEDYRVGSDDAKVVIVEFADYQCPACSAARKTFEDLHKEVGDRVLFVFKNFPLSNKCNGSMQSDMHPYSCDIARLARCAGQYGKFWEYHKLAFDEQSRASLEQAKVWGQKVGLTEAQITQCLNSADILAKLRDDADVGTRAGVDGTPAVYINGRKYTGERTVQALRSAIEGISN